MTNVPNDIRNAWADVYKLFDVSYGMDGSPGAWEKYWNTATELVKQYGDEIPLLELFEATAHMLEIFVKRRETGNKTLYWRADEDYPYPN